MATKKAKNQPVLTDDSSDLFAAATQKSITKPKKQPGTIFPLPKVLGDNGELTPDCAQLHEAVHNVIEAAKEENDAINRGDVAKGILNPYVLGQYVSKVAANGCLPTTPVVLANHRGESLTYVVMDKSQQYGLSDEQLQILREMLGADTVARITFQYRQYSFNANTMQEIAGELPTGLNADEMTALPRVHNVVAKVVSKALTDAVNDGLITDEQRLNLLSADVKVKLRKGEFDNIAQWAGADASRISAVIETLGSSVVRYLKA